MIRKLVLFLIYCLISLQQILFAQVLTVGDVYNYNIGDVFVRQTFSSGVPPRTSKTNITNKYYSIAVDTVFYIYDEFTYTPPACSLCTATASSTMGNIMFYTNLHDTITKSYNTGSNPYDTSAFCLDTNGFNGYWLNFSGPSTQFCNRITSEIIYESGGLAGDSTCLWFFESTKIKYFYGEGIGQTLYEYNDCAFGGFPCNFGTQLIYYKKDTVECGVNPITNYLISGNVFEDINTNCVQETSEDSLKNILVKLTSYNSIQYAYTGPDGMYSLQNLFIDSTYTLEVLMETKPYWELSSCFSNPQNITITSGIDTIEKNIPLSKKVSCPLMEVDISTSFLRRCFDNTYQVHYCNNGTEDANGVYIDIYFDDDLLVNSSSLPWSSVSGNMYSFYIGNVAYGDCGNFSINTTLECDSTLLGQTHCVQANIYPDSLCLPYDPDWDGSIIEVSGQCINHDSIVFTISNIGSGDMSGPRNYIIVEDDIMYVSNTFQLNAGDNYVVSIPANGQTYRLEAEQSPDYYFPGFASSVVEGCNGIDSVGFVVILPENDLSPFISIDCQENIGAYDPNDKNGYPKGTGIEKYITATDEIEYKIRFQNTGTDTAFNIYIIDSISAYLDVASIQVGASSHPYTIDIYGNGVVKWTFTNILLPDSTTNEPGSHGFIKFRIKQKEGNSDGTVITNRAGIYFDFNAPVYTNTEFNTIGQRGTDFVVRIAPDELFLSNLQNIYPNPFSNYATIHLKQNYAHLYISIYTLEGKILQEKYLENTSEIKLDAANLQPGILIFKILSDNEKVITGKIIVQKN